MQPSETLGLLAICQSIPVDRLQGWPAIEEIKQYEQKRNRRVIENGQPE